MICRRRRTARAARSADRALRQARRKDPHLGRRALQFHQSSRGSGELPVAEPRFLPFGAVALYASRFHRTGRALPHSLARKDARAALLRQDLARRYRAVENGVRSRRRPVADALCGAGCHPRRRRVRGVDVDGTGAWRGDGHRNRRPGVPKIGATPFGYRIAEQFGIAIVPPRPALVPLAFDPASAGAIRRPVGRVRRRRSVVQRRQVPRGAAVYYSLNNSTLSSRCPPRTLGGEGIVRGLYLCCEVGPQIHIPLRCRVQPLAIV